MAHIFNNIFVDDEFLIRNAADNTIFLDINISGTAATSTTFDVSQTANRTISFPDATTTLVGTDTTDVLSNKTLTLPQINDTSLDHQYVFAVNELTADRTVTLPLLTGNDTFLFEDHPATLTNKTLSSAILTNPEINDTSQDHQYVFAVNELTADRTVTLPLLTGNDTFVFEAHSQTLTNKTIDADNNTISNLAHGAEVDNPSSGVHGVTGDVVGTTDTQTLTNKTLTSPVLTTPEINDTSLDHQYVVAVSELTADRTVTLPLLTGNDTFVFEAHTQTLTNKTLTSPIINEILDSNGNQEVVFVTTASAVNEFTVTNAATGTNPELSATGDDANVGFDFQAKGTGTYRFLATADTSTVISLFEDTDNGSNSVSLQAPAALGGNFTLTLPGSTDTLVARDTTDTLTNKTITSTTNTVRATQLGTTGADVNVSSATAPTEGQVLQATAATTATWQYRGWRESVRAATTGAGTLASDFENTDVIDGVTLATNDRILIKNQGDPTENGIYIVQATGAPLRANDYASGSSVASTFVIAQEGTANADTLWMCTNNSGTDVVGTDGLTFAQISGSGDVTGPGSSTDNAIVRWDGTGGDTIQNSGVTLDDSQNVSGINTIVFETGANDLTLAAATQTTGAATATLPDLGGTGGNLVIDNLAQTLSNKTLTLPQINDTSLDHQYVFGVNELTADRTVTLPLLTGNDTFVFEAHSQTLTNKDLVDSSTAVVDAGDNTIQILFNAAGTTSTSTTLTSSQTANRVITLPDATTTLVGTDTTDTLSNKTLTLPQINDTSEDHQYVFAVSELTADRTVTLPLLTGNDTFVFEAHTQTLTNKTLTSPIINEILDSNGNEEVIFVTTASAVNEFTITNAATTDSPVLSVTGDDANIDLSLQVKGTGTYELLGTATTQAFLRFYEDTDNGTNYVAVAPPAAISGNVTLTLPVATDQLVGRATTDTLTNKTITGATNNVEADSLKTTGSPVNVSGAAPPTTGQVLKATSATTATWQDEGQETFTDDTFAIQDAGDNTIEILFDAAGTTSTSTTLTSSQTANRVITFPDATTTVVGTDVTQTLTNKTLTSPIINEILDSNGNELLIFTTTASAVNEFTLANAATGTNPSFASTGGDANIGIDFQVKGTGTYQLLGTTTTQAFLRFYEDTDNGTNYIALAPAAAITSNSTLTLPEATDTLVARATTDTLTNKTITGSTNTVHASHLRTTGAAVDVVSAAPPTSGQVLTATSATTATWQTGGTGLASYQLVGPQASASSTNFTAIGYFPWLDSRYSSYTSGIVVLRATIGDRNLNIRLRDVTNAATLGSATVSSTGSTSFSVTNPASDAQVELQISKSANGGTNPLIFGVVLEFST
jgi:phosphoribosylcarboxyaminoimidazole (NCAIR) mutase